MSHRAPHLPHEVHDRAELEKFRRYLRELGEWDLTYQPNHSPHTHAQANERIRARLRAEVEIYERVYGEKIQ